MPFKCLCSLQSQACVNQQCIAVVFYTNKSSVFQAACLSLVDHEEGVRSHCTRLPSWPTDLLQLGWPLSCPCASGTASWRKVSCTVLKRCPSQALWRYLSLGSLLVSVGIRVSVRQVAVFKFPWDQWQGGTAACSKIALLAFSVPLNIFKNQAGDYLPAVRQDV